MNCWDFEEPTKAVVDSLVKEAKQSAQVEILTWAMRLCFTGSTPSMIRKALHNKLVEITGEGERA